MGGLLGQLREPSRRLPPVRGSCCGVDPAGRKHLQEVLEAAGGQLDDTKRLRNLQDYLIPRGGCSPSLTARLNSVLQRANNVLKRVDEHFPEWREAYRLIYGKGP